MGTLAVNQSLASMGVACVGRSLHLLIALLKFQYGIEPKDVVGLFSVVQCGDVVETRLDICRFGRAIAISEWVELQFDLGGRGYELSRLWKQEYSPRCDFGF